MGPVSQRNRAGIDMFHPASEQEREPLPPCDRMGQPEVIVGRNPDQHQPAGRAGKFRTGGDGRPRPRRLEYQVDAAAAGWDGYDKFPIARYPRLAAYVAAHYTLAETVSGVAIYRRKDERILRDGQLLWPH